MGEAEGELVGGFDGDREGAVLGLETEGEVLGRLEEPGDMEGVLEGVLDGVLEGS